MSKRGGGGLKTTSAALGVSSTEVRCMLGGLGFDALGPAPSTMPDAGPGRLVGGPGRPGALLGAAPAERFRGLGFRVSKN